MKTQHHKSETARQKRSAIIDEVIAKIKSLMSRNRENLSVEDLELHMQCIAELEELKEPPDDDDSSLGLKHIVKLVQLLCEFYSIEW